MRDAAADQADRRQALRTQQLSLLSGDPAFQLASPGLQLFQRPRSFDRPGDSLAKHLHQVQRRRLQRLRLEEVNMSHTDHPSAQLDRRRHVGGHTALAEIRGARSRLRGQICALDQLAGCRERCGESLRGGAHHPPEAFVAHVHRGARLQAAGSRIGQKNGPRVAADAGDDSLQELLQERVERQVGERDVRQRLQGRQIGVGRRQVRGLRAQALLSLLQCRRHVREGAGQCGQLVLRGPPRQANLFLTELANERIVSGLHGACRQDQPASK